MKYSLQLKLARVLNTLRTVEVRDGDNGNLMKMVACVGELETIIKEVGEHEAPDQQGKDTRCDRLRSSE